MITYHPDLIQGSDEWLAARCGILTASEMKLIITPTGKTASNDKERAHLWELLAQRITKYVEPHYVSDDMLRGSEDEIEARAIYDREYAPVHEMGFIVNQRLGFPIGYSPDGLVGWHSAGSGGGLIECKSRRQKFQVETIVSGVVPPEFMVQIQTGLLVSEREWCDFVSYSGGLPMIVIRVFPDVVMQDAIISAATAFEERLNARLELYRNALSGTRRMTPTERRVEQEMMI